MKMWSRSVNGCYSVRQEPWWDEYYAVLTTDSEFSEDADVLVTTLESEFDDFTPEEQHPVDPKDEDCWLSVSFSPADVLPQSNAPSSFPATSWAPPRKPLRTRSRRQWSRRAAASHRKRSGRYRGFRAPSPVRRRHGCRCNCSGWSRTSSTYNPRGTSWEHLPVVIEPTKWYQVVGSMQCSICKAEGRHQMTSWMCQICQEPLCLRPYRNCFSRWHGLRC